jgi:PleD family two-component response regulator
MALRQVENRIQFDRSVESLFEQIAQEVAPLHVTMCNPDIMRFTLATGS